MAQTKQRKKLTKTTHIALVSSLSHEGRGIATINGKTVFIHNALPSEEVEVKVTASHARHASGHAIQIQNPSAIRVTPKCAFYENCGGCQLQHMHHDEQIRLKQQVFLEQLTHFGKIAPKTTLPPLTGPIYGYRNKARLGVRYVQGKQKLLIGFRERNGRYISVMDHCEICHPAISEQIEPLQQLISKLSIYNQIPQLEVAKGDDHVAIVVRHLCDFSAKDLVLLHDFSLQTGVHIYSQSKGPDTIVKLYPSDQRERLYYALDDFNLTIAFHPTDFTQINPQMNKKMLATAMQWLDPKPGETVLDLFCGLGNFTLPIATFGATVVGVEGSASMVKRGYENATTNQIQGVTFHQADLHENLTPASWNQKQYDKILLDPPRSGAKLIVTHIDQFSPKRIVYISCNPSTLARDGNLLVHEHGYTLTAAGIMDMFPHTSHVEAMAIFDKKG